ncbi:hypothetical protein ACFQ07_31360, partial [Actinomadura adrarensis]
SDCGLTDQARRLCWQHIDRYRQAGTRLTVQQARYMLEPAVNLARLHIRDNTPQAALRILNAMYSAVNNGTDLTIDDQRLPLAHLTGIRQERNKLREWVWLQLLTDGTRALTRAGEWADALALAQAHRGIGEHLMEGRQVAILAACTDGATDRARAILRESMLTQPWEHQVATCLEVICNGPGQQARHRAITAMIHNFQDNETAVGYAVFRARLGLTVIALTGPDAPDTGRCLLIQVADEAIAASDGYAAREILNHPTPDIHPSAAQRRALTDMVTTSGLGTGPLQSPLHNTFTSNINMASRTLTASLMESWSKEPLS